MENQIQLGSYCNLPISILSLSLSLNKSSCCNFSPIPSTEFSTTAVADDSDCRTQCLAGCTATFRLRLPPRMIVPPPHPPQMSGRAAPRWRRRPSASHSPLPKQSSAPNRRSPNPRRLPPPVRIPPYRSRPPTRTETLIQARRRFSLPWLDSPAPSTKSTIPPGRMTTRSTVGSESGSRRRRR